MHKKLGIILFVLTAVLSCHKDTETTLNCEVNSELENITQRNFNMGFSTWSFGPSLSDKEETYQFLTTNADMYSEQIDYKIPWNALINNTAFPDAFLTDINYRVSKRISNHKLLLSVSLLNNNRDDLLEDYDGTIPDYTALNDTIIENAYYKYLDFLITQFNPDYVVTAMEINELKLHSETKWTACKSLMKNIREKLKNAYPDIIFAESITLHNWFDPDVPNQAEFISDITNYVNENAELVAISYYPFFKGQHTAPEFQKAFDFLHSQTNLPIAFVETNDIAEDLIIENLNVNIKSNVCEQKEYLETLLINAYRHQYKFVIWWAYRDYDQLWQTFPPEIQDVTKIWKDTGLLDENGNERPAYFVWKQILNQ